MDYSGNSGMVRRLALLFANHADNFQSGSEPPSDAGFSWGEYSAREKYLATEFARAAIDRMMEPTPEMVAAGVEGYFDDTMGDQAVGPRQAAAVFKAMLSEALSPSLKEQEDRTP